MMVDQSVKVVKSISLVLRLRDDYTLGDIKGAVKIFINHQQRRPIIKPGGYHIFINVEEPVEHIAVLSDYYMKQEISVKDQESLKKKDWFDIRLIPSLGYPFGENATLCWIQTEGEKTDQDIFGYISDKNYHHGRIIKKISDYECNVAYAYDSFRAGDFYLAHKEDGKHFVTVDEVLSEGVVKFKEKLPELKKGDKLFKAIKTATDTYGTGVVYLNRLHKDQVCMNLIIGAQSSDKEVEIDFIEGKSIKCHIPNV